MHCVSTSVWVYKNKQFTRHEMQIKNYHLLGLMSGSSLDGLDVALVHFSCGFRQTKNGRKEVREIEWECLQAKTLPYEPDWVERLKQLPEATTTEVMATHAAFGRYLGDLLAPLLPKMPRHPQAAALHGHTLLHEPARGFSFQIGEGHALAERLQLPVIADFRTADIALGGQGAPMSPLADKLLFQGFDAYLNIGGIANLTTCQDGHWLACDIGPANQIFNALASEKALPFDRDGALGSRGRCLENLLHTALQDEYYSRPAPKSLSNQWVRQGPLELFSKTTAPVEDRLHTAYKLLAQLLAQQLRQTFHENTQKPRRIFLSGGGAHNTFLRKCLEEAIAPLHFSLHLPPKEIIDFKEAILMALAGMLRLENAPNFVPETTGAREAAVGGVVFGL